MSLWGNKDSKSSTGTIAINTSGAVTGSSTLFTTEAKVGDYIRTNDGSDFQIVSIADNTHCTVRNGIVGQTPTAIGAGASYILSEKPKYVTNSESNISSGVSGNSTKVFGVDTTEIRVNGSKVAHSGWVRRIQGSGGRSGRVQTEVLVANSSISGDNSDDTQFPDA